MPRGARGAEASPLVCSTSECCFNRSFPHSLFVRRDQRFFKFCPVPVSVCLLWSWPTPRGGRVRPRRHPTGGVVFLYFRPETQKKIGIPKLTRVTEPLPPGGPPGKVKVLCSPNCQPQPRSPCQCLQPRANLKEMPDRHTTHTYRCCRWAQGEPFPGWHCPSSLIDHRPMSTCTPTRRTQALMHTPHPNASLQQ